MKKKSGSGSQDAKHIDPLDFRIRSRDENGHYEKIQTSVPPELHTELVSLATSGAFDFDGIGGFVRWAIVHGIEQLAAYKPKYPSQIAIVRAISLENARSEVRREFKKQLEGTAKEAFELAAAGLTSEAAKHVQRVLHLIRKMDPEDKWRAVYEKEVQTRFGHLLKVGKISSLVPDQPAPADPGVDQSEWDDSWHTQPPTTM